MIRPAHLTVLLAACGGVSGARPSTAPVAETAAPAPLPAPPRKAGRSTETVACTFREALLPEQIRWPLRVGPSGAVYATLAPHAASPVEPRFDVVAALSTAGGDLHVKVSHGGVELEGWVAQSDLPLYLRASTELDGFVYPTGAARLEVRPAEGGLRVLPVDVHRATMRVAPRAVSCADVALQQGDYDSLASLHLPQDRTLVDLRRGSIELRLEPGGATVATFDSKPDDDVAVLVASRGSERRVAWPLGDVWLVGWVSSAAVRPHRADAGDSGTSFGVSNGPHAQPDETVEPPPGVVSVCSRDVRIDAEVGGLRTHVGRVKAGTYLGLGAKVGDAREVNLARGVAVAPSAKLVASTTELASCTPL